MSEPSASGSKLDLTDRNDYAGCVVAEVWMDQEVKRIFKSWGFTDIEIPRPTFSWIDGPDGKTRLRVEVAYEGTWRPLTPEKLEALRGKWGF